MPETTVKIEIDGAQLASEDLVRVGEIELEEATGSADAAALTAQLEPTPDGGWESVLDDLTAPKTKLTVEVSRGGSRYRFDGLSTEAAWEVAPDAASRLTVKAVDRTLEMNVEEKVTRWSGTNDSAIADTILSSYGLSTDVTSTPDSPDPDVHVVVQRASDWAFLRALATKWGYAVYVDASELAPVGVFKPLDARAEPQAKLAFGFGSDARSASVHVELLSGRSVSAARIAPLSSDVVQASDDGTTEAQGADSLGGKTTVLLAPGDVDGEIDPNETTKGVASRSAFGVRLQATVDTEQIGTIIRARRTVEVEGLGSKLSGTYLVDSVRHRVSPDGHLQQVTLVRNALGNGGPFG